VGRRPVSDNHRPPVEHRFYGAIGDLYGLSVGAVEEMNPAVASDCKSLWLSYYYCVAVPDTSMQIPFELAIDKRRFSTLADVVEGLERECLRFSLLLT
jgi:hypothetical protein